MGEGADERKPEDCIALASPVERLEGQMATVGKDLADQLKASDGYYSDDTRVVEITEYDNAFGGVGYGLTYAGTPNRYTPSKFVRNPRVYWKAE